MPVIYVDVDDTLVRSFGSKRIPMTMAIQGVVALKEQGFTLYLWSSGGADYCKRTAAELGIENIFEGFLPKPNIYVDDQPISEWRELTHQYPMGGT